MSTTGQHDDTPHTTAPDAPSAQAGSQADVSPPSGVEGDAGYVAFGHDELAVILSHYDLGVIESIQPYRRGSRRSPKALVKSEMGLFLLKRRAEGRDDPARVGFAHRIQLHLASRGFPVAPIIPTRKHHGSMVLRGGRIYELFSFVGGGKFDQSPDATFDAGRTLALFHVLLTDHQPAVDPPTSGYHGSVQIAAQLPAICERLDPALAPIGERLARAYRASGERADELGLPKWPRQIIHGDWHPGNMLFAGARVLAVLDYDTARLEARALDLANGALQFSITRVGENPDQWPDHLDEVRLSRFIAGYESASFGRISRAEVAALPALMIEALIVEAVVPIAATGRFGPVPGARFLQMVDRKVAWLQQHAPRLVQNLT